MKKAITIAAVTMAVFTLSYAFVSCQKENDWICTCNFTDEYGEAQSLPNYIIHVNKKVAKSACKELDKSTRELFGNGGCSLK